MFKVGDEVVCVDDGATSPQHVWLGDKPIKGAVYTVRSVGISDLTLEPGIWLREIRNGTDDNAYRASRFRKVQRRDLTEWLSTAVKNTDHIDKRTKVPA